MFGEVNKVSPLTQKRTVITIDGLAGSGKSSLAYQLSLKLGFQHLNTGILYRTVGFLVLEKQAEVLKNKVKATLEQSVVDALNSFSLFLDKDSLDSPVVRISDGRVLSFDQLQSEEISTISSRIAVFSEVRDYLLPIQRNAYPGHNLVAEGRDMGTVVFPEATRKFFIEVPADIRAERRYRQLIGSTLLKNEDPEEMKKTIKFDILERDRRDQERVLAPCAPAPDAFIFSNTAPSLTQAVDELYHLASR